MTARGVDPRTKRLTLAAVLVVFLLGALDNTIVATAMPRIVAELEGLSLYAWVTTAYLLASTVMVPIYGKLSDMYGRKPILTVGIALFPFGSKLGGLAGEFGQLPLIGGGMAQLVASRAVQGLGSAALFSSAFAVIADLIPASERGRYQGLFGGVFGLASILGPRIGGFLTDHGTVALFRTAIEGWRWVFYVNVPLGLLSLYLIRTHMPDLRTVRATGRIDVAGAALIVIGLVPLLLALTWGRQRFAFAWTAPQIVTLLSVTAAALIAFGVVERRVANPILPLELFRLPVFAWVNAASFTFNVAFLGFVMFLPLFMQLVLGVSATNSGFALGLRAAAADGRVDRVLDGGGVRRDAHRGRHNDARPSLADGAGRHRPRTGAEPVHPGRAERRARRPHRRRDVGQPVLPPDRRPSGWRPSAPC